jgi:hypothetical protein
MRNGTNERIYIDLGFKLTNFTSFGESLFSEDYSRKPPRGTYLSKEHLELKYDIYARRL